jgi:hypothetical protein
MANLQGPTLADTGGKRRLRKLKERIGIINQHIAELRSKKHLIRWEILTLRLEIAITWIRGIV